VTAIISNNASTIEGELFIFMEKNISGYSGSLSNNANVNCHINDLKEINKNVCENQKFPFGVDQNH